MKIITLSLVTALVLLSSCVSSKKFKSSEAAKNDCLQREQQNLVRISNLEMQVHALEEDTAVLGNRFRVLEKDKTYFEEMTAREVSELNQALRKKESELNQKESALQEREKKLQELQAIIQRQEDAVNNLRNTVARALGGFRNDELTVEMKGGKVYVSLSEKLLFQSGSATVDAKGKEALVKLAEVLAKNPEIDIMIEGHTDSIPMKGGKFQDNWELSVSRATSIVRILLDNGVNARQVTAAGRGEFFPVAANTSPEGRSRNRRTEIILSPRLDELFRMLDQQ